MNSLRAFLERRYPARGKHHRAPAPAAVLVDAYLPSRPCFAAVVDLTAIAVEARAVRVLPSAAAWQAARSLVRSR